MSKGSKIVPVRIPKELVAEMKKAIISRNKVTREEPWKMSDFIRVCIRQKLDHLKRSNRKRTRADGTTYEVGMRIEP